MNEESDLNVRSFSIQQLYSMYRGDRFEVNRRYQRKLVWSVDEKRRLIDSALRQLPIPLILVAEKPAEVISQYEVIDGLQRLNAFISFIENEYDVDGHYFDLETLADTKELKDSGELEQREPVLPREKSRQISNYTLALSVFRSASEAMVDEVFRRINSSGRKLSSQDLRQAGSISPLATLVRKVSSQIRGDISRTDIVPLSLMARLSISGPDLKYEINVDEIFWVKQAILNRENVRQSRDEEVVLDVLIDMLSDRTLASSAVTRDAVYDFQSDQNAEPTRQSVEIENAIITRTPEAVKDEFFRTYDELRKIIDASGERFCDLIGIGSGNPIPRYFHCVFMAVLQLLRANREFSDYKRAAECLRDRYQRFGVQKSGGDWSSPNKADAIGIVRSFLEPATVPSTSGLSALHGHASFVEQILASSRIEHQLFELKQGFLPLEAAAANPAPALDRIVRTAAAMANTDPPNVGYIVVGVADSPDDADRVLKIDHVTSVSYLEFRLVGLAREAKRAGMDSLGRYWDSITRRLRAHGSVSPEFAQTLANRARLVPYRGTQVAILEVTPGTSPVFYDREIYERQGSETVLVEPSGYQAVFRRFERANS